MIGWGIYLLVLRVAGLTPTGAAFAGALAVAVVSALQSKLRHCPTTVFLVCGIIPLVPGGGIFWTAYHLVSNHLSLAATTGFAALKVTIAIAAGIIIVGTLSIRLQKRGAKTRPE